MSGQAWATYLPGEAPHADGTKPKGVSLFARDFQTVVIYDSKGDFVGVRRPGSGLPIEVRSSLLCEMPVLNSPAYTFTDSNHDRQTARANLIMCSLCREQYMHVVLKPVIR